MRNALRSAARRAAMRFSLLAAAFLLFVAGAGFLAFTGFGLLNHAFGPAIAGLATSAALLLAAGASGWLGLRRPRKREAAQREEAPDRQESMPVDMLAGAAFAIAFVIARQWAAGRQPRK